MKTTMQPHQSNDPAHSEISPVSRYRLYRQTRTGIHVLEFQTESATEAVDAFRRQMPAFEGGKIRLWDHHTQRIAASVLWNLEKDDSGLPVFNRTNLFHDRQLEEIDHRMRQETSEGLRQDVRTGIGLQ
jgi:hypothetical protein